MTSEWQTLPIGEIGKVVTGKTPSTAVDHYYGCDYPFYTPSDMDGRKRLESTKRSLSTEGINSIRGSIIEAGAVMVSCIGSDMGKVAIAASKGATNQQINTILVSQGFDPEYIYYELLTRKDELQMLATGGSAQPILNKGNFCQIEICVPPLPEQRAIAHILGTLDDKIELNRSTNETLEAMAKALFKSWFVDFDPVRAKAEGRSTGLPDEISDLFPDSFEESELGEIPKGWAIASLGEILDVDKGVSYKGDFLSDSEGLPMVNLGCFAGGGVFREEKMKFYAGEYRERHLASAGDLLIANTDMTQNRIILGAPIVVPPWKGMSKFLFSHHTFAVRFRRSKTTLTRFIYFTLLKPSFRQVAAGHATGTTVLALPKDGVTDYQTVIPPSEILEIFALKVDGLFRKCHLAIEQNTVVARIRDTLLPKLISGELRIPDAEKLLEDAGL